MKNRKMLATWLVRLYERVIGTDEMVHESLLEEVDCPRGVDSSDAREALETLCNLSSCSVCGKWAEWNGYDWRCKEECE